LIARAIAVEGERLAAATTSSGTGGRGTTSSAACTALPSHWRATQATHPVGVTSHGRRARWTRCARWTGPPGRRSSRFRARDRSRCLPGSTPSGPLSWSSVSARSRAGSPDTPRGWAPPSPGTSTCPGDTPQLGTRRPALWPAELRHGDREHLAAGDGAARSGDRQRVRSGRGVGVGADPQGDVAVESPTRSSGWLRRIGAKRVSNQRAKNAACLRPQLSQSVASLPYPKPRVYGTPKSQCPHGGHPRSSAAPPLTLVSLGPRRSTTPSARAAQLGGTTPRQRDSADRISGSLGGR